MDLQVVSLVVSVCFLVLAWLAVGLRGFVRVRMLNSFGMDDWFILLSLAIFTALIAFIIEATNYSTSGTAAVPKSTIRHSLEFHVLSEVTYTATTCTLKISIALLLLRINQRVLYFWILGISIAFTCIYSLIILFLTLFQCQPISYSWDNPTTGGSLYGTCFSNNERGAIAYAFSAMAIGTGWLYAILPIFMLMGTKMSWQLKLYVTLVLGLGALACIATIVRLTYIVQLVSNNTEPTPSAPVLIWTVVEPGIGIIAASGATFRPLLQYLRFSGLSEHSQSNNETWPRTHSSWHELSGVRKGNSRVFAQGALKDGAESNTVLCESEVSLSQVHTS